MKRLWNCIFLIILISVFSCGKPATKSYTPQDIQEAFRGGQYSFATHLTDSLINRGNADSSTIANLLSMKDMADRVLSDFRLSDSTVNARLTKEFGTYSTEEKEMWEKNNWLEYRLIDGKKLYFSRAVSNLKLILASRQPARLGAASPTTDPFSIFCLDHSRKVIAESSTGKPVVPQNLKITYSLTVDADAVPDGEIIRCWMPWPKESHNRQANVAFLKSVPENHFISPDSVGQRSVYMEQKAIKGKPTLFEIGFTYQPMAQFFDLNHLKILPYDTTSQVFKKNTIEQLPQIAFSNEIKYLSDSIIGGSKKPIDKVKKLYYWINDHIIWTGALEYSIISDIPGYVLHNRRGDCGMQTLLFMTMARYQGIPVKWQSGWMMHPGKVNLHDWAEVYYEGVGWVPLDMSFNLQQSANLTEKEFYISGIDAYRLIVNDAISSEFVPTKKFPRSEPYDFQRGEVEWRGGNLYFNKWDYHMEVARMNE
ncbi:MAG: transglutaminase-like domain-containing protein [Mariniphaga sp.]